jgi:hypothetical protein
VYSRYGLGALAMTMKRSLEALAAPAAVATISAEYSRPHRLSQRMSVLLATQLRLSTQTTHPDA